MIGTDSERDINKEISEVEATLRTLKTELRQRYASKKDKHSCPYCKWEWIGHKEHPIECVNCKRRLVKTEAIITTVDVELQDEGKCREACAKLDVLVLKKGFIERKYPIFNRFYTLKSDNDKIVVTKVENDVRCWEKTLVSSYELLRDWDWMDFMKPFLVEIQKI